MDFKHTPLKAILIGINAWFLRVFSFCWILFLVLDYLAHNEVYKNSFSSATGWLIAITLLIFVAGAFVVGNSKKWLDNLRKGTIVLKNVKGWQVYLLFLITSFLCFTFYGNKVGALEDGAMGGAMSYLVKLLGLNLVLFLFTLSAFSIGKLVLPFLNLKVSKLTHTLLSIASGITLITLIMFLLGTLNLLWFYVIGPILILPIIFNWKRNIEFLKSLFLMPFKERPTNLLGLLSLFAILFFIASNFIAIMRPIPFGFDALNLYMITPKLIDGYHGLAQGGQAYNWSIIMSLGFIFGKSVPLALGLSVLPGILSILFIYQIAKKFVSHNSALIASALFFTLPIILWQSTNEIKVDLGSLLILFAALLLLVENTNVKKVLKLRKGKLYDKFFQSKLGNILLEDKQLGTWILMGWLCGYAFGVKYTALFAIFGFVVFLFYKYASRWAFIGIFFIIFAVIFQFDLYRFSNDSITINSPLLVIIPFIAGAALLVISFLKDKLKLRNVLKYVSVFTVVTFISISPWIIKNLSENKKIDVNSMFDGKKPIKPLKLSEQIAPPSNWYASNESFLLSQNEAPAKKKTEKQGKAKKKNNKSNVKTSNKNANQTSTTNPTPIAKKKKGFVATGKYEEINRYIGYEKGILKYISFPYDAAMGNNVNLFSNDLGFLMLILIPLIIFSLKAKNNGINLLLNLVKAALLILFLVVSIASSYMAQGPFRRELAMSYIDKITADDTDFFKEIYTYVYKIFIQLAESATGLLDLLSKQNEIASYYIIIASIVVLIALYFHSIKNLPKPIKYFLAFMASFFLFFMALASGITWYGLLMIASAPIIMMYFLTVKNDSLLNDKVVKIFGFAIITFWLVSSITFRSVRVLPAIDSDLQSKIFMQYAAGSLDAEKVLESINPAIKRGADAINKDRNAGVLRIGTYINYFVSNSDKRVYIDNQLDLFNKMRGISTDKLALNSKLKQNNIGYIVVDLNTGTIDNTPGKTLTAKMNELYGFLYNNPRIQLITTDRVVEDDASQMFFNVNGKKIPGSRKVFGKSIINNGSIAVFKIL